MKEIKLKTDTDKHCPSCGKIILRGRTDKKYCSDLCRSSVHNATNRKKFSQICRVNKILKHNYDILEMLIKLRTNISKNQLVEMGFIDRFFTSETIFSGKKVKLYYEYGLYPQGTNHYNIVKLSTVFHQAVSRVEVQ